MEWERLTNDQVEELLVGLGRKQSEVIGHQLAALEELDRRQAHTADGCRSLSEWAAQKLDVSQSTAQGLVRTMRRTNGKPHLRDALASGVSYDRVDALSRLTDNSDSDSLLFELDVAGVHRRAADRVRVTARDEQDAFDSQYFVMQPNLDESYWRAWGGFDGLSGQVINQALTEKADQLPTEPDEPRRSLAWRKAFALYELASGGQTPKTQLTVFIDAAQAVPTNGEAGVRLQAGPRVGAQTIEAILCDATTEVIVSGEDGTPLRYGSTQTIPPSLKRAALAKTGGHCGIDGCDSRYRVEVHHITPRSQGGNHEIGNLIPLCWYHHHVAVHRMGLQLYVHETGRIRLRRPPGASRPERDVVLAGRHKPESPPGTGGVPAAKPPGRGESSQPVP